MIIDWTTSAYRQLRTQVLGPVWNFIATMGVTGPVVSERFDLIGVDNRNLNLVGVDDQDFGLEGVDDRSFSLRGA